FLSQSGWLYVVRITETYIAQLGVREENLPRQHVDFDFVDQRCARKIIHRGSLSDLFTVEAGTVSPQQQNSVSHFHDQIVNPRAGLAANRSLDSRQAAALFFAWYRHYGLNVGLHAGSLR